MPPNTAYMRDYFEDNAKYVNQYGEKTILLKQCGAFWEMYGISRSDGSITGSAMEDIARITDLAIANRLGAQTYKMIGFGLASRDKYVSKMMNAGYTVPIMPQVREGSNSPHYLEMVVTPGTAFIDNETTLSRHTACLWVEKVSALNPVSRPTILCGMSVIDVFTGESAFGEFDMEYRHQSATFDEMERFISVYNPTETIVIHNLSESDIEDIVQFIGVKSRKLHIHSFDDSGRVGDIERCQQQTYQEKTIALHYPGNDIDVFFEPFRQRLSATSAFCYLLNYLHNNNARLTREIGAPSIITNPDRLITANHSLVQLNIVEDGYHTGKNTAVVSSVDHCKTPMGSRALRKTILSPTTAPEELNREYRYYGVHAQQLHNSRRYTQWSARCARLRQDEPDDIHGHNSTAHVLHVGGQYTACGQTVGDGSLARPFGGLLQCQTASYSFSCVDVQRRMRLCRAHPDTGGMSES